MYWRVVGPGAQLRARRSVKSGKVARLAPGSVVLVLEQCDAELGERDKVGSERLRVEFEGTQGWLSQKCVEPCVPREDPVAQLLEAAHAPLVAAAERVRGLAKKKASGPLLITLCSDAREVTGLYEMAALALSDTGLSARASAAAATAYANCGCLFLNLEKGLQEREEKGAQAAAAAAAKDDKEAVSEEEEEKRKTEAEAEVESASKTMADAVVREVAKFGAVFAECFDEDRRADSLCALAVAIIQAVVDAATGDGSPPALFVTDDLVVACAASEPRAVRTAAFLARLLAPALGEARLRSAVPVADVVPLAPLAAFVEACAKARTNWVSTTLLAALRQPEKAEAKEGKAALFSKGRTLRLYGASIPVPGVVLAALSRQLVGRAATAELAEAFAKIAAGADAPLEALSAQRIERVATIALECAADDDHDDDDHDASARLSRSLFYDVANAAAAIICAPTVVASAATMSNADLLNLVLGDDVSSLPSVFGDPEDPLVRAHVARVQGLAAALATPPPAERWLEDWVKNVLAARVRLARHDTDIRALCGGDAEPPPENSAAAVSVALWLKRRLAQQDRPVVDLFSPPPPQGGSDNHDDDEEGAQNNGPPPTLREVSYALGAFPAFVDLVQPAVQAHPQCGLRSVAVVRRVAEALLDRGGDLALARCVARFRFRLGHDELVRADDNNKAGDEYARKVMAHADAVSRSWCCRALKTIAPPSSVKEEKEEEEVQDAPKGLSEAFHGRLARCQQMHRNLRAERLRAAQARGATKRRQVRDDRCVENDAIRHRLAAATKNPPRPTTADDGHLDEEAPSHGWGDSPPVGNPLRPLGNPHADEEAMSQADGWGDPPVGKNPPAAAAASSSSSLGTQDGPPPVDDVAKKSEEDDGDGPPEEEEEEEEEENDDDAPGAREEDATDDESPPPFAASPDEPGLAPAKNRSGDEPPGPEPPADDDPVEDPVSSDPNVGAPAPPSKKAMPRRQEDDPPPDPSMKKKLPVPATDASTYDPVPEVSTTPSEEDTGSVGRASAGMDDEDDATESTEEEAERDTILERRRLAAQGMISDEYRLGYITRPEPGVEGGVDATVTPSDGASFPGDGHLIKALDPAAMVERVVDAFRDGLRRGSKRVKTGLPSSAPPAEEEAAAAAPHTPPPLPPRDVGRSPENKNGTPAALNASSSSLPRPQDRASGEYDDDVGAHPVPPSDDPTREGDRRRIADINDNSPSAPQRTSGALEDAAAAVDPQSKEFRGLPSSSSSLPPSILGVVSSSSGDRATSPPEPPALQSSSADLKKNRNIDDANRRETTPSAASQEGELDDNADDGGAGSLGPSAPPAGHPAAARHGGGEAPAPAPAALLEAPVAEAPAPGAVVDEFFIEDETVLRVDALIELAEACGLPAVSAREAFALAMRFGRTWASCLGANPSGGARARLRIFIRGEEPGLVCSSGGGEKKVEDALSDEPLVAESIGAMVEEAAEAVRLARFDLETLLWAPHGAEVFSATETVGWKPPGICRCAEVTGSGLCTCCAPKKKDHHHGTRDVFLGTTRRSRRREAVWRAEALLDESRGSLRRLVRRVHRSGDPPEVAAAAAAAASSSETTTTTGAPWKKKNKARRAADIPPPRDVVVEDGVLRRVEDGQLGSVHVDASTTMWSGSDAFANAVAESWLAHASSQTLDAEGLVAATAASWAAPHPNDGEEEEEAAAKKKKKIARLVDAARAVFDLAAAGEDSEAMDSVEAIDLPIQAQLRPLRHPVHSDLATLRSHGRAALRLLETALNFGGGGGGGGGGGEVSAGITSTPSLRLLESFEMAALSAEEAEALAAEAPDLPSVMGLSRCAMTFASAAQLRGGFEDLEALARNPSDASKNNLLGLRVVRCLNLFRRPSATGYRCVRLVVKVPLDHRSGGDFALRPKDRVEAQSRSLDRVRGRVVQAHRGGLYDVRFDDGHVEARVAAKYLRKEQENDASSSSIISFVPGDVVHAHRFDNSEGGGGGKFYPARVLQEVVGQVDVAYEAHADLEGSRLAGLGTMDRTRLRTWHYVEVTLKLRAIEAASFSLPSLEEVSTESSSTGSSSALSEIIGPDLHLDPERAASTVWLTAAAHTGLVSQHDAHQKEDRLPPRRNNGGGGDPLAAFELVANRLFDDDDDDRGSPHREPSRGDEEAAANNNTTTTTTTTTTATTTTLEVVGRTAVPGRGKPKDRATVDGAGFRRALASEACGALEASPALERVLFERFFASRGSVELRYRPLLLWVVPRRSSHIIPIRVIMHVTLGGWSRTLVKSFAVAVKAASTVGRLKRHLARLRAHRSLYKEYWPGEVSSLAKHAAEDNDPSSRGPASSSSSSSSSESYADRLRARVTDGRRFRVDLYRDAPTPTLYAPAKIAYDDPIAYRDADPLYAVLQYGETIHCVLLAQNDQAASPKRAPKTAARRNRSSPTRSGR